MFLENSIVVDSQYATMDSNTRWNPQNSANIVFHQLFPALFPALPCMLFKGDALSFTSRIIFFSPALLIRCDLLYCSPPLCVLCPYH